MMRPMTKDSRMVILMATEKESLLDSNEVIKRVIKKVKWME
jgi:hypothetical protein